MRFAVYLIFHVLCSVAVVRLMYVAVHERTLEFYVHVGIVIAAGVVSSTLFAAMNPTWRR